MSAKTPTHPGSGIRDDLEELGWTVTEAARRMGVRREALSLLMHGRTGISPRMAHALERGGLSAANLADFSSSRPKSAYRRTESFLWPDHLGRPSGTSIMRAP